MPAKGQNKTVQRDAAISAKPGLQSRVTCLEILKAVESGTHFDEALRLATKLPDRDRRFVRLLAATCLRRSGQLDIVLRKLMSRPPSGKVALAMTIMKMGAAQLLFLETGAHAAVNSTVELMRAAGLDRMTGLANAVMRRLTREGEALLAKTSARHNLPDWLRVSWNEAYGAEATNAIMELSMSPPPLDITPAKDATGWAERLDGKLIDRRTIRREFDGDITALDGYEDGAWWIQDAAAALPASLFGDLAGKDAIDLCAAPGGKTAQLIAAGANVIAIDPSKARLRTLRDNLKRLGMSATTIAAEGQSYTPDMPVDAVLIDAPCSATGTLRRRPDVLHHRTRKDIDEMMTIQRDLLTRAAGWLKADGRLIYATCSLQPEEGEAIIADYLRRPDCRLRVDPITADEAGEFAPALTADGMMRIKPHDFAALGGVDGFFVARLKSAS